MKTRHLRGEPFKTRCGLSVMRISVAITESRATCEACIEAEKAVHERRMAENANYRRSHERIEALAMLGIKAERGSCIGQITLSAGEVDKLIRRLRARRDELTLDKLPRMR